MLTHLQIRDFAIVDHLELEFFPGMTAMTGETGAGKSIMIDALGLLLGDRADSTSVRAGARRAEISALFDLRDLPAACTWLGQRDLESGQECHLRRVINADARSRAYINGSPQPLQALKDFGELLVDIHGQHEHQSLLKRDNQRQLLDDYAQNSSLLVELANHFKTWSRLRQHLENLQQADAQRDARLDLLRYQIRELEALNLQDGEVEQLEEEHLRLANAGRLLDMCQRSLGYLYENDEVSIQGLLSQTLQELHNLSTVDVQLAPIGELLNTALIQVQEASDELRRYTQAVELDPRRLEWVDQRLADIHAMARKHNRPAPELPILLEELRAEMQELDNSDLRRGELQQELEQTSQAYLHCAETLSARRGTAAADLSNHVSTAMHSLGMGGGHFEVSLERHNKPSINGLETVEFMVSANPGQPLRPLNKVASGGELSRISLAIQVITAHSARIPTLLFDEVDTGIGGGIAEVVGKQLRTLGNTQQVLCVTHLPQVAAQAHQHLKISKQTEGLSTKTAVATLAQEERIQEIARMLGGLKLTKSTLAHAREMIEHTSRE